MRNCYDYKLRPTAIEMKNPGLIFTLLVLAFRAVLQVLSSKLAEFVEGIAVVLEREVKLAMIGNNSGGYYFFVGVGMVLGRWELESGLLEVESKLLEVEVELLEPET